MFWLRQLFKKCEQALILRERNIHSSQMTAKEEENTLFLADLRDTILLRLNQLERKPPIMPSAYNDDEFVDYMCYMLYRADCMLE